jgi:hypothetical protein
LSPVYESRDSDEQADPSLGYEDYSVDVSFEYDPGVKVSATGGDDDSVPAVWKERSALWKKVVSWTTERTNDWPTCPHPDPGNANEVLLFAKIILAKPLAGPDGCIIYRVSGIYTYCLTTPLTDDLTLFVCKSPNNNLTAAENTMPAIKFDKSLLQPQ